MRTQTLTESTPPSESWGKSGDGVWERAWLGTCLEKATFDASRRTVSGHTAAYFCHRTEGRVKASVLLDLGGRGLAL